MKISTVRSVCECEARLSAEVDEGYAAQAGRARFAGEELGAPANTARRHGEYFDVGWQCPFCGRNTLRSFHAGALSFRQAAPAAAQ